MATRFYFHTSAGGAAAPVTVTQSATWTGTAASVKRALQRKGFALAASTLASAQGPTNGSATQDVCARLYVSDPLPPQTITGTVSLVMSGLEAAATNNLQLACIVRVVSNDGATERGVVLSNLAIDTEWGTTQATRILNAATVTNVTAQSGDRLVVELGDHHAAGDLTVASAMFYGTSGASDFALTSGLTTNLNPWIEFSQDFWPALPNNYQAIEVGNGMSASERIR